MAYFDGYIKELNPPKKESIDNLNQFIQSEIKNWQVYDKIKPNNFYVFEDSTEHIVFQYINILNNHFSSFYFPWWPKWEKYIKPLIGEVTTSYNYQTGKTARIMLARLKAREKIKLHIDKHRFASIPHKIHIPLITDPEVFFSFKDHECHLEFGKAYEVNNKIKHGGVNNSSIDRIHLIFEYFDGEKYPDEF